MKRSIITLILSLILGIVAFSQPLKGIKTVGGDDKDYVTIKDAIAALNAQGVDSVLIFNVTDGYTETFVYPTDGRITTTTSSAANPVIFQKAGPGANPVIKSGTGTGVFDAIITFAGCDYVTFDGINLRDNPANGGSDSKAEWGYAILKASGTDGSQNITIRNCSVRMDTNYNASIGIYSNNHLMGGNTQLAVTANSGTNSNLKIYSDSISSYSSIWLQGFGDPVSPYSYYDQNNEIGVGGQNTITKVAGLDGYAGYGIYGRCQNNLKVANSRIGSVMTGNGAPYGIYLWHSKNGNFDLYNNYVSMIYTGGTGTTNFSPIYCTMGAYGQGNFDNIYNNIVTGCTYSKMTSATANYMFLDSLGSNVSFHDNSVTYNTTGSSSFTATGTIYYMWARKQTGSVQTGTFSMYNNTVSNNQRIQSATGSGNTYFIANRGTSTTVNFYNNTAANNVVAANGTCYSLYSYGEGIKNIYGNTISGITKAEGTFYGIYDFPVISNSGDQYIYKNTVTNIESNSSSSTMYGIYNVTSGVSSYLYNNMFSDFRATAATGSGSPTINMYGIYISQATFVGVYDNSVYLNASSSGTNFGSCAFYNGSTSHLLDLRGNIFTNTSTAKGTGKTLAFRHSGVPTTNFQAISNNNDYYAGTPSASNCIFYDGTTYYQTLAAYKTAVFPRESQSVTELPPFMSTTPGSVNLKISGATPTQVESAGAIISTPVAVTNDFENDPRYPNAGYPVNPSYPPSLPDMGADEFGGKPNDLTGPAISLTPLSNINHTNNRYLTVNISDGSGIPISGAGMPMLYWKTQSSSYSGVQGVYVSPGTYSFYFGGGPNLQIGDVISYYVVAQDLWSTPNLSAIPPTGALGLTPNPPACSTPPTTPYSYTIMANISGVFHVGVGKDFANLTAAAAALNSKWIYGPVTLYLDDNTYTETYPVTFNNNPGSSATNTVTIKPYTGATPAFTASVGGTGATGMIKLNGIDYLTIDGTALGNSNTRDLTIQNTFSNGTNNFGQYGIYITSNGTDPSTNNTIKGCKVGCNIPAYSQIANVSFTIYDIYFTSTGGPYDNTIIDNNWLKGAYFGVYARMSATAPATNLQVINNRIGSETSTEYIINSGVYLEYCNYPVISNNDISGYATGVGNWSQMGIGIGSNAKGSKVTRNVIHDFFRNDIPGTNQGPLAGIYYNSTDITAVSEFSDNVFYNLKYYGFSPTATQSNLAGMFFRSGGNLKIIHNSINMTGAVLFGGNDASSTCLLFYYQANGGNIEIKDNILRNGQTAYQSNPVNGKAFGIMTSLPLSYFNNINNNDYWIDGYNGHIAIYTDNSTFASTYYQTLASWQTATGGQEMNSLNVDPVFTSDTYLLPTTGSMPHAGVYMPLVPVDITGATRSNPPDIGAYEFTINPLINTTGYSSLTSSSVTLEGSVSSTGEAMNLFFDWGLTSLYGNTEIATPLSVPGHTLTTMSAVLSTLAPGTTYHFRARGVNDPSGLTIYGADMTFTTPALVKTLSLKVLYEGLYAGNGIMNQAYDENGAHFAPGIADQVTVELHNTSTYGTIEYSSGLVNMTTSGDISITDLPVSISGSYYITIKHRNSIETTTGFPISFAGNTVSFDFTIAAPQAFGANQKDVGGKFVFWSGDVNQDGIIDSGDLNYVDNASTAVLMGYVPEDVNGDGIVDSSDMNFVDNNSTAIIIAQLP
jgi:trimeric autotransporter adhesin